jgi:hypothetical protein
LTLLYRRLDATLIQMANVAVAAFELFDLLAVDIEAKHGKPFFGESQRQR